MTQSPIRPVNRTKAAAQRSYDRMSRWYDWFAASERKFTDVGLDLLAAQPRERILELGPGTGYGLAALGQSVSKGGLVAGLDLSAGMLAQAAQQVRQARVADWVYLAQGDAAHLPFASQLFDAVLMSFTLELFDTPEIPQVLSEVARVLGENGRYCVISLAKEEKRLAVRLYEWAHDHFPSYADCRPIYVENMLLAAGFHIEKRVTMRMWGLPVTIALAVPPARPATH